MASIDNPVSSPMRHDAIWRRQLLYEPTMSEVLPINSVYTTTAVPVCRSSLQLIQKFVGTTLLTGEEHRSIAQ